MKTLSLFKALHLNVNVWFLKCAFHLLLFKIWYFESIISPISKKFKFNKIHLQDMATYYSWRGLLHFGKKMYIIVFKLGCIWQIWNLAFLWYKNIHWTTLVNRPGVAGAVLQTPLWLIDSFSHHFPPNLQDIINPKTLELGSWNFERMFTPHHVSHVRCHVSCVRCQVSGVRCHV